MHEHPPTAGRPPRTWALTIALCSVAMVASLTLPAAASAENCPNAVYRSGPSSRLPDCRAYEMVTPPYKEGFPVYVQTGFQNHGSRELSAEGSRVAGQSYGAFAGTEDSVFAGTGTQLSSGAYYLFTRELTGWTPTAISLPADQYSMATGWALSSELTQSLWVSATPVQEEEGYADGAEQPAASFYMRTLNGPIAKVGPILPPTVNAGEVRRGYFEFQGTSSGDLSVVLYSMKEHHWPGDETEPGAESLYEYFGTGNSEPQLVGVSGGPNSKDLVSKCGTQLALPGNALQGPSVSEDGTTVFFAALECGASPLVQEIYARVDNGLSDAHTVAISEPSSTDCVECDTAENVRQPAIVTGFSSDGSKVFFTTSQPLLGKDTTNNLYEYDFEGEVDHRILRVSSGDSTVPEPAAGVERVIDVSPDGSHVYFTASGVLTSVPNGIGQMAEAGRSNLYLYERDSQYPTGRTIFVMPGSDYAEGSMSQNGRFLVFNSLAHLTPDDLSSLAQGFEYDSQSGRIVRVSIGQDGYNEDGNTGSVRHLLVANDGSVYFETANPLVPQAANDQEDVYEYRSGNVSLITSGQDPHASAVIGSVLDYISPSGDDVFFQTFDQLVPRDTDSQEDTYDARVDGGFAESPSPSPCDGDACQGTLSSAPVLLSPGSKFQAGGENVPGGAPTVTSVADTRHKSNAKHTAKRMPKRKRRKSLATRRRIGGRGGSR